MGDYAFRAVYSGDANYTATTTSCEPFSVAQSGPGTATVVFDAATNTAWAGTEKTGASAYDTATVTGAGGVTPTGTVTYTFFTNNACTGTGVSAGTVTLTGAGAVPNSNTQGPLAAGSYSFRASIPVTPTMPPLPAAASRSASPSSARTRPQSSLMQPPIRRGRGPKRRGRRRLILRR